MKNQSLVASSLLIAGMLSAQSTSPLPLEPATTRGITSSWSAGILFAGNDTVIGRKEAGLPATVNQFTNPRANVPDYRETAINGWFSGLAGFTTTPVSFKAFSSGNDAAPLYYTSTGEFWVGQSNFNGYAFLLIAVKSLVNGGYDGLFGYYFDNPSFPSQLRNSVYYEVLPNELQSGVVAVPSNGDIGAIDVAMGLIDASNGRPHLGINPETTRLYFVLSSLSALLLEMELGNNHLMFDDGGQNAYTSPLTGSTVFVAIYDGGSGQLQEIRVHQDGAGLGIPAQEQIDALCVSEVPGTAVVPSSGQALEPGTLQYILSTEAATTAEPEQLFVVATPTGATGPRKGRFRTNRGDRLVGTGGTLTDVDVAGACAGDPDGAPIGGVSFGEPETPPTDDAVGMGLSLHARTSGTTGGTTRDKFMLTGVVSGWGAGSPEKSLVYLYVEVVNVVGNPSVILNLPGMRANNQDTFRFDQVLDIPWGGPDNRYRMKVMQLGLVTGTLNESIVELITRRP